MSTSQNPDRDRNKLIGYIAGKLQPLYCERPVSRDLCGWLAPLSTAQLIASLEQDAAATADALAVRLVGGTSSDVEDELLFLAELEYPRMPHARHRQLAGFAATVRRIATDGDGTAKAGDLYAEGYSSAVAADLMPRAKHLIAMLGGTAARRGRLPEDHTTPAARLAAAGARAAGQAVPR